MYKIKRFSWFGFDKSKSSNKESFKLDISDISGTKSLNDLFKLYPALKSVKNWANNLNLISEFNLLLDDYNIIKDSCALESNLGNKNWDTVVNWIEHDRNHYKNNEIIIALNGFDNDLVYHTRLNKLFLMNNWNDSKYQKQLSSDQLILSSECKLDKFVSDIYKSIDYCINLATEEDDLPENLTKEIMSLYDKIKHIR